MQTLESLFYHSRKLIEKKGFVADAKARGKKVSGSHSAGSWFWAVPRLLTGG